MTWNGLKIDESPVSKLRIGSQSGVLSILRTAYVDDTILFLVTKKSVKVVIQTFDYLSLFPELKPNKSKSEIAVTGLLKKNQMVHHKSNVTS